MNSPRRSKHSLALLLVSFVFVVITASALLIGAITFLLFRLGILTRFGGRLGMYPILSALILSAVVGTALAALLRNLPLKPIRRVIAAIHEVAGGNFDVRVPVDGVDELAELGRSFNKMAEELSGIETLRSDFVNNFSHEFKTPIVSIRGFAKLLKEGRLTDEQRAEYIDIILQESQRLSNLSTNVLDMTKLEARQIVTDKTVYQLDEQILQTVLLLQQRWDQKSLDMEVDLHSVRVASDESLLQQVWVNLLDNAIKFTPPKGRVTLTLLSENGRAVFTISDTGPGMSETEMARIYDKFYQGDASHAAQGNGLGLSIAKRIMDLIGGTIAVQRAPGGGSTFTVTLPEQGPPPP